MMKHIYNWVDNVYYIVQKSNMRSRRAVEKLGGKLMNED